MIAIRMKKLINKFPQYKKEIENAVDKEIRTTTFAIEGGAKVACPVDTGALRNSIQSTTSRMKGLVQVGMDYGPFVEYGTPHQAAQPYLTPVSVKEINKLVDRLKNLGSLI